MAQQTQWIGARLRATRDITPDIRLFEIEPSHGFIPPTPGSHLRVMVQIGGRTDERRYSIIGPCVDGHYRIAVKRHAASRGGSAYMWSLAAGAPLKISAPANHFELSFGRPEYLLIAGGIGVTPIYAMAQALARAGARFRLLYACRSNADLAFVDDLRALIGDRLRVFTSEAGERIDMAAAIAELDPAGELHVCGPIGMLEAARRFWRDSGRPQGQLHFETFGNSGRFPAEPFRVKIPRLGLEIDVPANQSLLEALEAAGVEMIFDCRRGECGLCALSIVAAEGEVDHRDVFFSDDEKANNAKLCTCVSRAVGGVLTLDTGNRVE